MLLLIATIIFIPLQCIAEEVIYRGFVMQTFGAWFKIAAIILQAIVFTLGHEYNMVGQIEILVSGLIYGFFTWKTNGIEVSSAMHTANNFSLALSDMLGLTAATSAVQTTDVIVTIIFDIALCLVMYYVGKKTDWFGELPETS